MCIHNNEELVLPGVLEGTCACVLDCVVDVLVLPRVHVGTRACVLDCVLITPHPKGCSSVR